MEALKAIDKVIAGEEWIDLVIMDIDLGKNRLDGIETARQILEKYNIPIIFLTSHNEKEFVDKVGKITNYGYLLKPAGYFVLNQMIETALGHFEAKKKLVDIEQ